jgi:hypothetical protein
VSPVRVALLNTRPKPDHAAHMERLGLMTGGEWDACAVRRLTDAQVGILLNKVRG